MPGLPLSGLLCSETLIQLLKSNMKVPKCVVPNVPFLLFFLVTTTITLNSKVYRSPGLRNHARNSCKPYIVLWTPLTILPDASHLNSNECPVDVHHYVTVTCTFFTPLENMIAISHGQLHVFHDFSPIQVAI